MDDVQKFSFIIVMCYQEKPDFKHCPSVATEVASSTLSLVLFISMELSRA
jgi:hypothetical protein